VRRLAIIGAGAWGTALATAAGRAGSRPLLWARSPEVAAAINRRHENPVFLPGIALDPGIAATTHLAIATRDADAALLAVPAQTLRTVLETHRLLLPAGLPVVHCAKGIELDSLALMSEIGREVLPASPFAVLSGPTFATEVARGLPTAIAIAGSDPELARALVTALGSTRFRPYLSPDPIGVQVGGAVKNVVAIACGIIRGRGLGENAKAALITRGLAEMIRLGRAMGARAETFQGLSGLGDLVLTATAIKSRNHLLGLMLGRGKDPGAATSGRRMVVEGVATAAAVVRLARRFAIEMPISEAVAAIVHDGAPIAPMIEDLLRRPLRSE
jgi:glycerol-3-phosphate dehydrogenase (NAD(P)+)